MRDKQHRALSGPVGVGGCSFMRPVPRVSMCLRVLRAIVDASSFQRVEYLASPVMAGAHRTDFWGDDGQTHISERDRGPRSVAHVTRDQNQLAIEPIRWRGSQLWRTGKWRCREQPPDETAPPGGKDAAKENHEVHCPQHHPTPASQWPGKPASVQACDGHQRAGSGSSLDLALRSAVQTEP